MHLRVFEDPVVLRLHSAPVTQSMLTALAVSVVLVVVAIWLCASLQRRPDSLPAALASLFVETLDRNVSDIVGHPYPDISALSGSLFLFIATCNLAGHLPGAYPATGTLAATSALAIVVFLAVPVFGIRSLGLRGYLKHYFLPSALMAPLHVLSEFSRTLALALRLFGNVMSGHLVVALLIALAGLFLPVPVMLLDLLIGLLQAYIFAVLASVYIGAATAAGGEA